MVRLVYQEDMRPGAAKGAGSRKPAKSAADNCYSMVFFGNRFRVHRMLSDMYCR